MASKEKIDDLKLEALIKASDNGEEWAQREYGRIFDEYDMDPDFIERVCRARVNIYRANAERGDKNAILRYAHALAHLGNKSEAYNWYIRLINKGDTDAMLALSEQYNEYGCFGHNPNEEMRWLKSAANGGNAEAQNNLGRECLCESDQYNALLWYELSAKQNNAKGKIGYAGCLKDQLDALDEYSKGWNEVSPGRYDYIKKTYGVLSYQECRSVMNDLYWKIESLYLDGLNHCNSDAYLSEAFSGLSSLYLYPRGVCAPSYYLAAYYEFEESRVLDNNFAYDRCLEIIKENNLKVTKSDLQEWDKIGVFEWAKKHGIDIYAENTKKTNNENLDIYLMLEITEQEATNGCFKTVAVKECGKTYSVSIPKSSKDGTVIRLVGAGKHDIVTNKKGNVFVKIQIIAKKDIPDKKENKTDIMKKENSKSKFPSRIIVSWFIWISLGASLIFTFAVPGIILTIAMVLICIYGEYLIFHKKNVKIGRILVMIIPIIIGVPMSINFGAPIPALIALVVAGLFSW